MRLDPKWRRRSHRNSSPRQRQS